MRSHAARASLSVGRLDGGGGENGVHKRRNGENGDETEKTAARIPRARLPTAGRHEPPRTREREPGGGYGVMGLACAPRHVRPPDAGLRPASRLGRPIRLLRFVFVDSVASMLWVGVKPLVLSPPPRSPRASTATNTLTPFRRHASPAMRAGQNASGLCFYPGTRESRGPLRRCGLEPDTGRWYLLRFGQPLADPQRTVRTTRVRRAERPLRDLEHRARRHHTGGGIPPQRDH